MSKWMVSAKKADFERIAERFHISPVTARLIRNRNLISDEEIETYLSGGLSVCHDAEGLPDVLKAAKLLRERIAQGKRIRVVGDYDVDGICASAILVRGLTFLGADADFVVPHRVLDGYGINDAIVEAAHADGIDTILTCDNGIAAYAQAERAAACGMHMIITDHHDVPVRPESGEQVIPPADAVVDPKRLSPGGADYPFSGICGAVVAYKLLQVLYRLCGKEREAQAQALMDDLSELCAIATVCDVMPLTDENRPIVKEGMRRMSDSAFAGIRALVRVNGLTDGKMTVYRLGFVLGPCLNATGRLDSARRGVELLLADDDESAIHIAQELKELNTSRKQMTEQSLEAAIDAVRSRGDVPDKVLVIDLADAHEAVAGIVAGRVKEMFHRPAIVLTHGAEGIKGSGRSVPAYDMFRALSECGDLFEKFGGHPMAAGLTLKAGTDADALRTRLNARCTLTEEALEPVLHLDMELPPRHVTFELLAEWDLLEPFGNGNDRPLFAARDIRIRRGRLLGKSASVGKYDVADDKGNRFEMMLFRGVKEWNAFLAETFGEDIPERLYGEGLSEADDVRVKIAYRPDINEYQGRRTLQLVCEDYLA